jgi:hypothetical protein
VFSVTVTEAVTNVDRRDLPISDGSTHAALGLVVAIGLLVTAIGVDSCSARAVSSESIPVTATIPTGPLDADGRRPAADGASAAGIAHRAGLARAVPIS